MGGIEPASRRSPFRKNSFRMSSGYHTQTNAATLRGVKKKRLLRWPDFHGKMCSMLHGLNMKSCKLNATLQNVEGLGLENFVIVALSGGRVPKFLISRKFQMEFRVLDLEISRQ